MNFRACVPGPGLLLISCYWISAWVSRNLSSNRVVRTIVIKIVSFSDHLFRNKIAGCFWAKQLQIQRERGCGKMKLKCLVVVATLSKVNSMYLSIETSSGQNRSAEIFRKGWMIACQAISNLSDRVYHFMTWKNAVNVLRFLSEYFLLLDRLKDYFNFYQQPYLVCRIYNKCKEVT